MTGYAAVAAAAERAAKLPGPDPLDPNEPLPPCPALEAALEAFYADPMTDAIGMAGELSGAVIRAHIERHRCQGSGGQMAPRPFVYIRR